MPAPEDRPDTSPVGTTEWLEADGLGGFASGTGSGIRTRRYHALLLVARRPPSDRVVLVNGIEAHLTTSAGRFALSSQRYAPNVIHPDGHLHVWRFRLMPWPTWDFRFPDGTTLTQEIVALRGRSQVLLRFTIGAGNGVLEVRPLLSGRVDHALHHENSAFRFEAERHGAAVVFRPYPDLPAVRVLANGSYLHAPEWYRSFLYTREAERGLDCTEDLASPGVFAFDLSRGPADLVLAAGDLVGPADLVAEALMVHERRRRQPLPAAQRGVDAYCVARGNGQTLMAGYPWFTDWGRDTFISLRGLCLATGRIDAARAILIEWSGAVSQGMLPNRFCDHGEAPEYNSVDSALWFVVAVHALFARPDHGVSAEARGRLCSAVKAILEGYENGTRHGIRLDADGLLRAGEPGVQLTWMDAKIGDWVVTPRIGKPVEVQALWLNALAIGAALGGPSTAHWTAVAAQGRESFARRFWNAERGCLFDVVDVDHHAGRQDSALRPNQIFAVGGLPFPLLDGARARAVVDVVEQRLLTPVGLRSLAQDEPGYAAHYRGGPRERDGAYHQGTVWPWLLGPFVEAWLRVRGNSLAARREAGTRFAAPLRSIADAAGGHLFEVADAEPPHAAGGCPFQAWSLGELLRIEQLLAFHDQ